MPIDYSKYPPNWKTEIRPRIMKRANNICEFKGCDFKHLEYVWSVKLYGGGFGWFREYKDAENEAIKSGWMCELSDPIIRKVKVVLTIAHLDHDETNWNIKDDRLKAACQLCHLRYDAKEKYRRRTAHLN